MSSKLKTCPWCGGSVRLVSDTKNRNEKWYFVSCTNKNCEIQPLTPGYSSVDAVMKAWNDRQGE